MPRVIWQGRIAVHSLDAIAVELRECRIVDGAVTKDVTFANFPAPVCGLTVERLGKDSMGGPLWLPVGTFHDGGAEFTTVLATALRDLCGKLPSEPSA